MASKQKLSPKAAKDKARRDLAMANTKRRKTMRAENQKKHRDNPGQKGKDYDHTTGKFTSVKSNRGGQGNGTKGKPKSTSYKVNKKKK